MYEKFEKLCTEKGVNPHKVSKDTGVNYSCLTDWKAGRSKPKFDKLLKLARYFGVNVEYFSGEEEKKQSEKFGIASECKE